MRVSRPAERNGGEPAGNATQGRKYERKRWTAPTAACRAVHRAHNTVKVLATRLGSAASATDLQAAGKRPLTTTWARWMNFLMDALDLLVMFSKPLVVSPYGE